jgi:rSAM/selenodomain-associated transferase 1
MTVAVGLLVRAPSAPGKTRLAGHVPPRRLAELRAAFLSDAVDVLARTSSIDGFVFFTPPATEAEIMSMAAGMCAIAQRGQDLGARMCSAMEELLERRGYAAAMIVGADVPLMTPRHLAEAAELLARDTIVLGPADDGGYYLIGMRRLRSELFASEEVAWGTETALTDTLRIADRIGAEARLIRSAYDVDTIEGLRRAAADLAQAPAHVAPHLRRWLADDYPPFGLR